MFHPGPAKIDCEKCQQFVHDLETGELKTYATTVDGERKELPQARPPGTRPPCEKCPKQSPEKAAEHELSQKNWLAYAHYRQAKAVGLSERERADPIVRRNFAIIDNLVRQFEAKRAAEFTATELAKLMPR